MDLLQHPSRTRVALLLLVAALGCFVENTSAFRKFKHKDYDNFNKEDCDEFGRPLHHQDWGSDKFMFHQGDWGNLKNKDDFLAQGYHQQDLLHWGIDDVMDDVMTREGDLDPRRSQKHHAGRKRDGDGRRDDHHHHDGKDDKDDDKHHQHHSPYKKVAIVLCCAVGLAVAIATALAVYRKTVAKRRSTVAPPTPEKMKRYDVTDHDLSHDHKNGAIPPVEGFPTPPAYVIAGVPPPSYSMTSAGAVGPAPCLYDHAHTARPPSSAPPTYSTIDLQTAVLESLQPASPTYVHVKPAGGRTEEI